MNATDFINKNLNCGDKVRLTLGYNAPGESYEGFFGGYKTFEGVNPDLTVYPVFYRAGKNGQMVQRSILGDGHSTAFCMCDIWDVEKVAVQYRHIGYYNNYQDCRDLSLRGHAAAIKAWKRGHGAFVNVNNDEPFDDVAEDGDTRLLEGGRYAVRFHDCGNITDEAVSKEAGNPDGTDCHSYIDIFERIDDAA